MRRILIALAGAALVGALAVSAMAVVGHGGPAGPHHNLNLIGVGNAKNPKLTNSKRRTIFVDLNVRSDIFLTEGDFEVCDGNSFDTATDCAGDNIGSVNKTGSVFQLPCNTNIVLDGADTIVPCVDASGRTAAEYEVWIRELGKPGGTADIITCVEAFDGTGRICSDDGAVLLVRGSSKPSFRNVTNKLISIKIGTVRTALFAGAYEDWLWQYDNNGLRLPQLRFYLLEDIKN